LGLSKNLMANNGGIFASIDDNEQEKLKTLMLSVFGADSFAACIPWRKRTAKSDVPFGISQDYEHILCLAKSSHFIASVEGKERRYFESDDFPNRPWRVHDMTKQTTATERPNSFFTMIDPKTGKEYPANPNATWRITKDTFQEYYDAGKIVFPDDYDFLNIKNPVMRYFKDDDMKKAGENFGRIPVSTKLPDSVGMSQDGTKEISALFGKKSFSFPKPKNLLQFLFETNTKNNNTILDYFAGSGTTARAVINLNREDGGRRKYILVEQGEYFDTVLKPRVQKVVYAENWKDGKPQADKESSLHGVPQIVKVLKLESYEDTLNNLVLKDNGDLLNQLNDGVKEDYLLRYMLADQSRDSLLNTDVFRRPFNYQMDIATNSAGATERMDIDLVETFNYLLGLRVHAVKDRIEKDGYLAVEGTLPDGETALVLWRDCEKVGYEGLDARD